MVNHWCDFLCANLFLFSGWCRWLRHVRSLSYSLSLSIRLLWQSSSSWSGWLNFSNNVIALFWWTWWSISSWWTYPSFCFFIRKLLMYLIAASLSLCIWVAWELSLSWNHLEGSILYSLKHEWRRYSPLQVIALIRWFCCCSTNDLISEQNSSNVFFSLLTFILITLLIHSGLLLWYCLGGSPRPALFWTGLIIDSLKTFALYLLK